MTEQASNEEVAESAFNAAVQQIIASYASNADETYLRVRGNARKVADKLLSRFESVLTAEQYSAFSAKIIETLMQYVGTMRKPKLEACLCIAEQLPAAFSGNSSDDMQYWVQAFDGINRYGDSKPQVQRALTIHGTETIFRSNSELRRLNRRNGPYVFLAVGAPKASDVDENVPDAASYQSDSEFLAEEDGPSTHEHEYVAVLEETAPGQDGNSSSPQNEPADGEAAAEATLDAEAENINAETFRNAGDRAEIPENALSQADKADFEDVTSEQGCGEHQLENSAAANETVAETSENTDSEILNTVPEETLAKTEQTIDSTPSALDEESVQVAEDRAGLSQNVTQEAENTSIAQYRQTQESMREPAEEAFSVQDSHGPSMIDELANDETAAYRDDARIETADINEEAFTNSIEASREKTSGPNEDMSTTDVSADMTAETQPDTEDTAELVGNGFHNEGTVNFENKTLQQDLGLHAAEVTLTEDASPVATTSNVATVSGVEAAPMYPTTQVKTETVLEPGSKPGSQPQAGGNAADVVDEVTSDIITHNAEESSPVDNVLTENALSELREISPDETNDAKQPANRSLRVETPDAAYPDKAADNAADSNIEGAGHQVGAEYNPDSANTPNHDPRLMSAAAHEIKSANLEAPDVALEGEAAGIIHGNTDQLRLEPIKDSNQVRHDRKAALDELEALAEKAPESESIAQTRSEQRETLIAEIKSEMGDMSPQAHETMRESSSKHNASRVPQEQATVLRHGHASNTTASIARQLGIAGPTISDVAAEAPASQQQGLEQSRAIPVSSRTVARSSINKTQSSQQHKTGATASQEAKHKPAAGQSSTTARRGEGVAAKDFRFQASGAAANNGASGGVSVGAHESDTQKPKPDNNFANNAAPVSNVSKSEESTQFKGHDVRGPDHQETSVAQENEQVLDTGTDKQVGTALQEEGQRKEGYGRDTSRSPVDHARSDIAVKPGSTVTAQAGPETGKSKEGDMTTEAPRDIEASSMQAEEAGEKRRDYIQVGPPDSRHSTENVRQWVPYYPDAGRNPGIADGNGGAKDLFNGCASCSGGYCMGCTKGATCQTKSEQPRATPA